MEKIKVAVLFGGASPEHEVSRVSATSVIKNIPKDKYEVYPIGITKDGKWFSFSGDINLIQGGQWEESGQNTPCLISPDTGVKGIMLLTQQGIKVQPVDVVFPVLHGKNGEDGTIQGLLELSGIPFVGCDTAASAVCMDKAYANALFDSMGIEQAKWLCLAYGEFVKRRDSIAADIQARLGETVFVKPANTGSSVGISKVKRIDQLVPAIENAFLYDRKVVMEQAIDGIEVECAVLGNDNPIASILGEITPSNEFYDYEAKYILDSKLTIPARVDDKTSERVRQIAIEAYKGLGCQGMARVDFFVEKSGRVLINELNTIPGFTSISMYPKLFEASGIPYPQLLDRLIQLAQKRAD